MLQIGIVGIGAISQKAYLPVMRQIQDCHWHLMTRKQDVLHEATALFGQASSYQSVADMLEQALDGVFIHSATEAHFELARQFLQAGIPVYMDKPISEKLEEVKSLYALAEENGTFLMAGFNRRFAPKVRELANLDKKTHILVEKNDVNRPGDLRFRLFDFFIHPLDTALYLADHAPTGGYYSYQLKDGLLSHVNVTLKTGETSLMVNMNLQSGSRREIIEVQTPEGTYRVKNLEELTLYRDGEERREGFASWDGTLYKRGFEDAISAFLEAIKSGNNPVSPSSSLLSHAICDQLLRAETPSGLLDIKKLW